MLSAFNEHFSTIPDNRQQSKVEHKLHYILLTLVVGVLCGADGWEAIEEVAHNKIALLKKYGSFEHGIPVHDTIARGIYINRLKTFLISVIRKVLQMYRINIMKK